MHNFLWCMLHHCDLWACNCVNQLRGAYCEISFSAAFVQHCQLLLWCALMLCTISTESKQALCRWKNARISIKLPAELSELLSLYLQRAHHVLSKSSKAGLPQVFMFMNNHCEPMANAQDMTHYWYYLLHRMGSRHAFPPHRWVHHK